MKKLFIISLLLLFLSWCSFKKDIAPITESTWNVTPITENTWNVTPIETTTEKVEDIITDWTPINPTTQEGEYTYPWNREFSKEQFEVFSWISIWCTNVKKESWNIVVDQVCEKVRWYRHIYLIPELWLKLTYNENYDFIDWYWSYNQNSMFLQKNPPTFIAKNSNSVYDMSDSNMFIKLIKKDPTKTPEQIIQTFTNPNCPFELWTKYIENVSPDLIVYAGGCKSKNDEWIGTYYYFSKTKTEYFYQEDYLNSCGGWTCGVFNINTKEFFLK